MGTTYGKVIGDCGCFRNETGHRGRGRGESEGGGGGEGERREGVLMLNETTTKYNNRTTKVLKTD